MKMEESILKKLAKNHYYQALISNKELGLKLFYNDIDLSPIQIYFLDLVNRYNSVYSDIALGEVNSIVMENDLYVDAYLTYKDFKYEEEKKQLKNPKKQDSNPRNEIKDPLRRETKFIFTKNPNKK